MLLYPHRKRLPFVRISSALSSSISHVARIDMCKSWKSEPKMTIGCLLVLFVCLFCFVLFVLFCLFVRLFGCVAVPVVRTSCSLCAQLSCHMGTTCHQGRVRGVRCGKVTWVWVKITSPIGPQMIGNQIAIMARSRYGSNCSTTNWTAALNVHVSIYQLGPAILGLPNSF